MTLVPSERDKGFNEAFAISQRGPATREKVSYIGAPACFALEQACKHLSDAFCEQSNVDHIGVYVVGSCLERPDWRDVDVRMIMDDASFARLFPGAQMIGGAVWEFDPRWCLLTVAVSQWLSKATGLPIDFQFQPMTFANERHKGRRHAVGLRFAPREAAAAKADKEQP